MSVLRLVPLALLCGCSQAAPLDTAAGRSPLAAGDTGAAGDGDGTDADGAADGDGPTYGAPAVVSAVVLNELLAGRSDDGPDWIELYNRGPEDVVLDGFLLTDAPDDAATPAWALPAGTTLAAGAFLVIDADEGDGPLSASFKLSKGGETVVLAAPDGTVLDRVETPALDDDQSYARAGDGGDPWGIDDAPSPGASNAGR